MIAQNQPPAGGRRCLPYLDAAGLPYRGPAILERERYSFPLMVNRLLGLGKTSSEGAVKRLTMEQLEQVFAARDGVALPAAAFIAGRCQPADPADGERLTALLHDLIDSLPVADLDVLAPSYIEAAMSLALRGEPEQAHRALLPLATDPAALITRSYLAAYYLAQLGDPIGYPALLANLRDESEHTRLMAARHLLGFRPYDGQTVAGRPVDVRAALIERLGDRKALVRVEIPALLVEAGIPDARELIEPVARADRKKVVRRAAREALTLL